MSERTHRKTEKDRVGYDKENVLDIIAYNF